MMTVDIRHAVSRVLSVNMGLGKGGRLLVVTDTPSAREWIELPVTTLEDFVDRIRLARTVHELACDLGYESLLLPFVSVEVSGSEPPDEVAKAMKDSDVVLLMTTHSLTHTEATGEAAGKGARLASMPGVTVDMFADGGAIGADADQMCELGQRIVDFCSGAETVRITCGHGSDLQLGLSGRVMGIDSGKLDSPGAVGNLPAGEVWVAPVEGTAEGRLVVPAGWFPMLTSGLELGFQRGVVSSVNGGGAVGDHLRMLLDLDGDDRMARRNCAELGIGINPLAQRADNVLEAEKIAGTVHVAIGDSTHLGGCVQADIHYDFVINKPTVTVDGREFMAGGKLLV